MAIVSHFYSFVVGIDTHARTHHLAIVSNTGELIDSQQFNATAAGHARAMTWITRRTDHASDVLVVIEGIATFGALLAGVVADAGFDLVEAARMSACLHRNVGKSDPLDAHRIATAVLPLRTDELRHPRLDAGARGALRVLLCAREDMTHERTAKVNALTGLLRRLALGIDARKPITPTQIVEVSRWRTRVEDIGMATARAECIRLAKRILDLNASLTQNMAEIADIVKASPAVPLLNEVGIGPVTAAVLYTVWSHPGRVRSEAAFASLCGVNPIPASSGNTRRHRLNRGGDRRANKALHMATLYRMGHDPETIAYINKRTAEGLSRRETRRCLKRYLARRAYRILNNTTRPQTTLTT